MRSILEPTHTRVKLLQWSLHLAIIPAIYFSAWQYWVITLITFWCMHGFGSGIGTHRYYVHGTFETNKFWELVFSFFFTISCTGSTIGYTLMHLKHHKYSDKEEDPHNPKGNFWKTWMGMYDEKKLTFAPKVFVRLMQNPIMRFFHKNYFGIIAAYVLVLALINPMLIIYMWAIPALMQFHINGILIALVHDPRVEKIGGYKDHSTNDDSYNLWWLKPITLGEELHNNHHAKPASPTMNRGAGWRDFDPLFYVIKYVIRGKFKDEIYNS